MLHQQRLTWWWHVQRHHLNTQQRHLCPAGSLAQAPGGRPMMLQNAHDIASHRHAHRVSSHALRYPTVVVRADAACAPVSVVMRADT